MTRFTYAVFIALLLSVAIYTVVAGATYEYKFPVTIIDTSNTTRNYYPVVLGFTGTTLQNAGKINASGNDTNIQESDENREFTIGTTHIATVLPELPAGGAVTADLYTGYSPEWATSSMVWGEGGYVTLADAAAVEPGDNFTLTIEDCYIDTTTTGNITKKDSAFYLHVPVAGNITGQIYGTSANVSALVASGEHDIIVDVSKSEYNVIQDSYVTPTYLYSARPRVGQYIPDITENTTITSVQFYMGKAGSPTGTANITVRQTDDTIIGLLGTIDVSTLGSVTWHTFTDDVNITATQDIRVTVEYSGGDGSNYVQLGYANSDVCDGYRTYYESGAWNDITDSDSSIKFYSSNALMSLTVDGTKEDENVLHDVAVPDTANDFIIGSDITPYMGSWTLAIDGVDTVQYEPTSIILGTTLPDRAGTAQNGVITWGSNTNCSIVYGEMESYESMELDTSDVGFDMPESTVPSTWFSDCEAGADLPFYEFVNDAATNSGVPVCTIYFVITIGLAFMVCVLVVVGTRSALLGVLGMVIVLFVGSSMTIVPMWIPFSVILVDFGIMFLYRQVSY